MPNNCSNFFWYSVPDRAPIETFYFMINCFFFNIWCNIYYTLFIMCVGHKLSKHWYDPSTLVLGFFLVFFRVGSGHILIIGIRCTSWFNAGSRIIQNYLMGCFFYLLPLQGPILIPFLTLLGIPYLPYNKHQYYYSQQSLGATFYQKVLQIQINVSTYISFIFFLLSSFPFFFMLPDFPSLGLFTILE